MIGVSGGLDSTHALIVAAKGHGRSAPAQRHPRVHDAGIRYRRGDEGQRVGVDEALGITFAEIDITAPARLMLPISATRSRRGEPVYDVTFENVQAGLRTDYLFRLANQRGGIVVGTGDLSELALGWSPTASVTRCPTTT